MAATENDPAFWRALYRPPRESTGQAATVRKSSVKIEEHDLVARLQPELLAEPGSSLHASTGSLRTLQEAPSAPQPGSAEQTDGVATERMVAPAPAAKASGRSSARPGKPKRGESSAEWEIEISIAEMELEPVALDELWDKIPSVPGGAETLVEAGPLNRDTTMLLVLVDGVTTLRGLHALTPKLSEEEFADIVHESLRRGLLALD